MTGDIKIEVEHQNHGEWIRIFVPFYSDKKSFVFIQNEAGKVIRQASLHDGNNALDLSGVTDTAVFIKIETEYETVFKKIQLRP